MIRFWFEFKKDNNRLPCVEIAMGCGVTAYNEQDAIEILKATVFKETAMPEIKQITPNVDISQLDKGHVQPNLVNHFQRGVWFPGGYEYIE